MARVIGVVVVDDDRMLRDGLATWLRDAPDLRLVGTYSTVDDLLAVGLDSVDVVVLDLVLGDGSRPVENVRRLVAAGVGVLVISVWLNLNQVSATFAAGASGYLTKDHDLAALADAVRTVSDGGTAYSPELALACLRDPRPERPNLSPREISVLLAYASGMTLGSAARHVGVRPETAKTYLDRVRAKYQALGRPTRTKLELAERVREDGIGSPPDLGT